MLYLLFDPLEPNKLPFLKELTTTEICLIWSATSQYIHTQLSKKNAVDVGIGTFAVVPAQARVGEGKPLPVETPTFQPCSFLKKFYQLKCTKTHISEETPRVPLNFKMIARKSHFIPDVVENCIHETLLVFADALRAKREVEWAFEGIGILAVRMKELSMTFFEGCLLELDTTGNMLEALLNDSRLLHIVAFPGKAKFSRRSPEGVIMLPSFVAETGKGPSVSQTSVKPSREPEPSACTARRVSLLDPIFMAQQRVYIYRQPKQKDHHDEDRAERHRFLPDKQGKELMQHKPPSEPRLKLPAQDAEPWEKAQPSSPRAERESQLLLAFRRRGVEEEVWQRYHASRERRSMEPGKTSCPYLFEEPYWPPYLLKKDYVQKMKERLREERLQKEMLQEEMLQEEMLQKEKLQEEMLQKEKLQEEMLQEEMLQEEMLQKEKLQEKLQKEMLQEEMLQEEMLQEKLWKERLWEERPWDERLQK